MSNMAHHPPDGGTREVEITIKPTETDLELALDAAAAANANQLAAMKREIAQLEEQVGWPLIEAKIDEEARAIIEYTSIFCFC
jgi:hypothetical protein